MHTPMCFRCVLQTRPSLPLFVGFKACESQTCRFCASANPPLCFGACSVYWCAL